MKTIWSLVGLIGLLAVIGSLLVAIGFVDVDVAHAQWLPENCYRQEFHKWPMSAHMTDYTFLHLNGEGLPVGGCGAVVNVSNDGTIRTFGKFDPGIYTWDIDQDGLGDVTIRNYRYRSPKYGNKLVAETRVQTFNGFVVTRIGEWNKSPGK